LGHQISAIANISRDYLHGIYSINRASIAERMSWAASRTTKRPEDIAYCLLGIFDINMPLLYGEGEKAFQRLQEEIVKRSDDQSILAWKTADVLPTHSTSREVFARSPKDFEACGNIVRSEQAGPTKPYAITNKGLEIELPIIRNGESSNVFAILNCRYANDTFANLALSLYQFSSDHWYERDRRELKVLPLSRCRRARLQSMYISMKRPEVGPVRGLEDNTCILRGLPYDYDMTALFPYGRWSKGMRTFEGNRNESFPLDPSNRTLVVIDSRLITCRLLFMTSLRRDKILRDWVWDARFLPATACHRSGLEQVLAEWKTQDLSYLPRTIVFNQKKLTLRAVPQVISGRRLTTIDILNHEIYQRWDSMKAVEETLVFLRSCGYASLCAIYWVLNQADLEFDGDSISRHAVKICAMVFNVVILAYQGYKSLLDAGSMTAFAGFSVFSSACALGSLVMFFRRKQYSQSARMTNLSWQNSRDYDLLVGLGIILTAVVVPVGLCCSLTFGWSLLTIAFYSFIISMIPFECVSQFEFVDSSL
jgi:hypothetical protein